MSKQTKGIKRGQVLDSRANKRSLSGYWGAPLPGGVGSTAIKSFSVRWGKKKTRTETDNLPIAAVARQSSFACDDQFTEIEVDSYSHIWGRLSDEW